MSGRAASAIEGPDSYSVAEEAAVTLHETYKYQWRCIQPNVEMIWNSRARAMGSD
jgi:hypothetical protein